MKYKKHIFVCTNQRPDGKACCGEKTGMDLVNLFKEELKANKLTVEVRAQKAGCFDVCSHGPAVVVYPEGIFYGHVQPEDVKQIVEEDIMANKPVERLRIKF